MAGTGRARAALRWPAGLAAVAMVLTAAGSVPAAAGPAPAVAGSAPATAGPGQPDLATVMEQCRKAVLALEQADGTGLALERADGTINAVSCAGDGFLPSPEPQGPALPTPTRPVTGGMPGCVTGSDRPVVDTVLTTVSASAEGVPAEEITYQYGPIDGPADIFSSGSAVLDFDPGQLAPGRSYRWRARAGIMRDISDDRGWSSWCEFAVSAQAPDYGQLGNASIDVLHELGLRPDREYTATLSGPQHRLLRQITGVRRGAAAVTLSGPRWTELLTQLADEAHYRTQGAIDIGEDPDPEVGEAYWALVDAISVKLGGPQHPKIQHR